VKPERTFVAERAAAQHCAELLHRAPPPIDPMPLLARFGERLTRLLPVALAPLHGGVPPIVSAAEPLTDESRQLVTAIPTLAGNCLLAAGSGATPLLLSFEPRGVFALLDRTFGGRGAVPSPLPESFPQSAELMIARLEGLVAAGIAQALGCEAEQVRALRRDSSLAALKPFKAGDAVTSLTLTVSDETSGDEWTLLLALARSALEALFGHGDRPATARPARTSADPVAEPFGAVPLPLSAVLVEMQVSMATISALEPGHVLPVAVARKVPLRIGGKTVAHGTVGALDDCAALQISHLA
jgi:flagellar motor switch protein FliM